MYQQKLINMILQKSNDNDKTVQIQLLFGNTIEKITAKRQNLN